jgi:hypothetical protein
LPQICAAAVDQKRNQPRINAKRRESRNGCVLFAVRGFRFSNHSITNLRIYQILVRAFPELVYPLHTSRLAIHLTPATRYPEAGHANCKVFRHGFREAKDRLRCTVGLSKAACMIGYPEEQRSRSFASHPEHGKGGEHRARSGWRIHEDGDW